MAAVRRLVGQLSSIPSFGASKSKVSSFQRAIFDPFSVSGASHFSHLVKSNNKQLFLLDDLTLVRRLEGEGVPSKQAEAIIAATTEVLKGGIENMSKSLVSKGEMQKIEMMQESNLSKFKVEVQCSQQHHFSQLQNETEKLRHDIEKMRIEWRYEIDKSIAGYRLDLQLEMGETMKEMSKLKTDTDNMIDKLDSGLNSLEAKLELVATKYLIRNCCIGTLSICVLLLLLFYA